MSRIMNQWPSSGKPTTTTRETVIAAISIWSGHTRNISEILGLFVDGAKCGDNDRLYSSPVSLIEFRYLLGKVTGNNVAAQAGFRCQLTVVDRKSTIKQHKTSHLLMVRQFAELPLNALCE